MRRDTQNVLLILVGGAAIRLTAGHAYLSYVRSWTRAYLLSAGATLVLLGVISLWRDHTADRAAGTDPDSGHDDGHAHGPGIAWLLLLPIFAIFLVGPPALGSYAAGNRGNDIAQPADPNAAFPPLPPGDPATVTLTDYATRAVWDAGRTLTGRRLHLVGFVTPRPGGGYYLTRMVITCCAADARPIKILVRGDPTGQHPPDSWLSITGRYAGLDKSDPHGTYPILRAETVTPVPAPAEPYET